MFNFLFEARMYGLYTLEPFITVFFIDADNSHEWEKSKGTSCRKIDGQHLQ